MRDHEYQMNTTQAIADILKENTKNPKDLQLYLDFLLCLESAYFLVQDKEREP